MRSTVFVVVPHIFYGLELGFGDEVPALRAGEGVVDGWTGFKGEDVRGSVLVDVRWC